MTGGVGLEVEEVAAAAVLDHLVELVAFDAVEQRSDRLARRDVDLGAEQGRPSVEHGEGCDEIG